MKNVAKKLQDDSAFQGMGTVIRLEGPIFVVRTDRGDLRCRRAVSCLVEPELHDYVLAVCQDKAAYVLAVLERESPDASIACEGNLELKLKNGRFRVAASETIDMVASKGVQVVSDSLGVHVNSAKLVASEIVALGARLVGEVANVSLKGSILDKAFERVSERVQRSFRRVEEIDQLKAKQVDYVAEHTMSLRSENMVATAKELVKVDGEQIHFG